MTVITKPTGEKKADKLDQPLVTAECLPHNDVEAGIGDGAPLPDPRLLILRARARRASSITTACLLLMALLVMCCGILGGFYLYKQFGYSQVHRLRGWCKIPYEDISQTSAVFTEFGKAYPDDDDSKPPRMREWKSDEHFMNEELEIDGDKNSYEKITVPTFEGGRSSRFIHDFNANKTGIMDVEAHRCFVMPLNRTQVLPPRNLIDLVRKMWEGFYDVDTEIIRETFRVKQPPLRDTRLAGVYIQRECAGYPIYELEKLVTGVFKRSIAATEPPSFTYFSGKYVKLSIINEDELKPSST